jgi:hypothetical protein
MAARRRPHRAAFDRDVAAVRCNADVVHLRRQIAVRIFECPDRAAQPATGSGTDHAVGNWWRRRPPYYRSPEYSVVRDHLL